MKKILGWTSVISMCIIACFCAFWGVLENFHEGWYFQNLWENIVLMLIQYLLFLVVCLLLSAIAIFHAKVGSFFIFLASIGLAYMLFGGRGFHFRQVVSWLPIFIPCVLTIVGYAWGTLPSRRNQILLTIALPLVLAVGLSLEPLQRISRRYYDGNYESRIIEGNNVTLLWAPKGPGWPNTTEAPDWYVAKDIISKLNEDGKTLSPTAVNIWRLPTVDEVVRSMSRFNRNCKGIWDSTAQQATYTMKPGPEKELPLWDQFSPIIYWWTDTEATPEKVYVVVYHGLVVARDKKSRLGSRGFRAVRNISTEPSKKE